MERGVDRQGWAGLYYGVELNTPSRRPTRPEPGILFAWIYAGRRCDTRPERGRSRRLPTSRVHAPGTRLNSGAELNEIVGGYSVTTHPGRAEVRRSRFIPKQVRGTPEGLEAFQGLEGEARGALHPTGRGH